MGTMDVDAISREQSIAMMENGEIINITDWLDEEGDECEPDEASFAIAPLPDGKWICIDLQAFHPVKTN